MKVKSILAVAFVLISFVAFANGNGDNKFVVIRGHEAGIFKVIFKGEDIVHATLNVFSKDGSLVFTKDIKGTNGFIQPINFTGLRTGEYTIEVKNNSNTWMQSITYAIESGRNSATHLEKSTSSIKYVHVLKLQSDGKYLLSVSGTENEPIKVRIFNDNDDLLLSKTLMTEGDLAVVFNIKEVTGKTRFRVTDKSGNSVAITK